MAVELQVSDSVFKLVAAENRFVPEGQKFPNGSVFIPSSNDERDARDRNTNVRLTVWDLELTTCKQAKEIWSRHVNCVAYGVSVADVVQIREVCKLERLRIVRDPLPDTVGPGFLAIAVSKGWIDPPVGAGKLTKRYWTKLLRDVSNWNASKKLDANNGVHFVSHLAHHRWHYVAVDVHRDGDRAVAEQLHDRARMDALREQQRGGAMPKIVET